MTGEIAPSGPSGRLPVWIPYVVCRAERTICRRRHAGGSFRKSPSACGLCRYHCWLHCHPPGFGLRKRWSSSSVGLLRRWTTGPPPLGYGIC